MGVPSLFRWLANRYKRCIYPVRNEPIDNLYIDLNGVIHPCCHPAKKPEPKTEAEMFREIFKAVDHLVSISRPKHLVYIAVDGVAPRAKMNQQRERRFKSGDDSASEAVRKEVDVEKKFDPNCITPGTPFMRRLHSSLMKYVESRIAQKTDVWDGLAVIYSGHSVPGEGEHKIYDFIRAVKGRGINHAICGLDADLIFLSLATHERSFRILREDVFWVEQQERSFCKQCNAEGHSAGNCVPLEFPPHIYLDIGVLREHLQEDFKQAVSLGADFERMVDDWVFICFFVGNDFLPSIPSMEIRVSAIETITASYINVLISRKKYLTDNGKICIQELVHLMDEIGSRENALLRAKLNSYVTFTRRKGETPREEDVNTKLYEEIGKTKYYADKLGITSPEELKNVCFEYVRGLAWVLHYYNKGCPSWGWYYPQHFAPLAKDIAGALREIPGSFLSFEKDQPKRPLEQIMAVLPPRSSKSVPKGLHRIFEESAENYPEKVEIDMFGKSQSWQGVAILPFLDYDKLVKDVRKCVLELPVEEVYGNIEETDLLIVSTSNPNYGVVESLYTSFDKQMGMALSVPFYSGIIQMDTHSALPGSQGVLEEEEREYLVSSVSAIFALNK